MKSKYFFQQLSILLFYAVLMTGLQGCGEFEGQSLSDSQSLDSSLQFSRSSIIDVPDSINLGGGELPAVTNARVVRENILAGGNQDITMRWTNPPGVDIRRIFISLIGHSGQIEKVENLRGRIRSGDFVLDETTASVILDEDSSPAAFRTRSQSRYQFLFPDIGGGAYLVYEDVNGRRSDLVEFIDPLFARLPNFNPNRMLVGRPLEKPIYVTSSRLFFLTSQT